MAMATASHTTMRAAVLEGPRRTAVLRLAVPEPDPGQVRVRLEGCGVCGSDVPTWEGAQGRGFPLPPGAPGHEGWGEIDAIGDGVAGLAVGDRVVTLSGSAFAERQLIPAPDLMRLPPSLAEQPFPGEALGYAMNVFKAAQIEKGQTVALVGVGFLGAILTRLAKDAGARVLAISPRPFALELATAWGAEEGVLLRDDDDVVAQVQTLTDGQGCERVIEGIGEQRPLDLAGRLAAERGRLVIAGHHAQPRQVDMPLWNARGLEIANVKVGDRRVHKAGILEAVDAIAQGKLDARPLYTHRFPLDRIDEAFETARARPAGYLKALVTF
jgi:threonine dehydrogenase-like Zn-dependent dehydrogenase